MHRQFLNAEPALSSLSYCIVFPQDPFFYFAFPST